MHAQRKKTQQFLKICMSKYKFNIGAAVIRQELQPCLKTEFHLHLQQYFRPNSKQNFILN